ncbi:glycine/D-amino acid oxidase-like deaminating enzyme [Actinoalloteichus hoggarensis]|uniref:D-amino acid dehydrogenase small subunit n=1 Tax=Actinoalloteichus hoggarensis TaxID=1470176 RepID=A0A221VYT9_9PSEU|nr:FAD-dependent oxidoreductase [Actinoalloteichus hoggarensis]ASO18723.1 D-amino acid dehydrogenase small subunit [Actinoalloteichus hoggarensis]MBB5919956.1 glycine/D-amino acid oxidase-like deaminating enzyme [Actinoalloteichus hoggarensis]
MAIDTADQNTTYDAVIVGNGGLGLSLGLVLARRGMRVAVVGESTRPFAASVAAGAMNGCFGEVTPTLLRSEYGRRKLAMDVRAAARWDDWERLLVEESDESRIRSANGTVVILNTIGVPGIDTAGYASIRQALHDYKEPYEDLDPEDVEWLAPEPKSRPLKAMFIPGEHAVDTPALLRGLTTAFGRQGGTLIDSHVSGLRLEGNRVTGVDLRTGGSLSSDTVVLAAGAASHDLLAGVDAEIRDRIPSLVSGSGVSLLVRTENGLIPDSVIRTPNRAFACGLHVVPRGDGVVYLGATNEILPRPCATAAIGEINLLLSGIRQLRADLVDGHIEKINVGNRPVPLDGYPLLGEAGVDGLWMMTGTYRDGLHQSPMLAEEMAARILGDAYDTDLDVFTPVRPPLQSLSREETLEVAVLHTMAVGVEHDWHLPEDLPPLIEEQFRRSFEQKLAEMESDFIPPPELLFFVEPEIESALRRYYDAYRNG